MGLTSTVLTAEYSEAVKWDYYTADHSDNTFGRASFISGYVGAVTSKQNLPALVSKQQSKPT